MLNKHPSQNTNTTPEAAEESINLDQPPEAVRRDFLKRFGGLAAATPVASFTLMSTMSSKAIASGGVGGGSDSL